MISLKEIVTEVWRQHINAYLNGNGFEVFRDVTSDLIDAGFDISNYQSHTALMYTFLLNNPKNPMVLTPAFDIVDTRGEHILKFFADNNVLNIVIVAKKENKFSKDFLTKVQKVLTDNNIEIEQANLNCIKGNITLPEGSGDTPVAPLPILGTRGVFLAH